MSMVFGLLKDLFVVTSEAEKHEVDDLFKSTTIWVE